MKCKKKTLKGKREEEAESRLSKMVGKPEEIKVKSRGSYQWRKQSAGRGQEEIWRP